MANAGGQFPGWIVRKHWLIIPPNRIGRDWPVVLTTRHFLADGYCRVLTHDGGGRVLGVRGDSCDGILRIVYDRPGHLRDLRDSTAHNRDCGTKRQHNPENTFEHAACLKQGRFIDKPTLPVSTPGNLSHFEMVGRH